MKEKLFSIFFCIYLFWGALSCAILGQQGLAMDGALMRTLLVIIFSLSIVFFLSFKKDKRDVRVLMVLGAFGALFYMTRLFYNFSSEGYQGQYLRWGSDCVSACLIGMTLMKLKDFSFIHKFLPIVCIILTPFFIQGTLEYASEQGQMHLESGMSYQSVAYNLAVLCCISLYYSFINKNSTSKLIRYIMIVLIPIQSVTCCMSGGRGGLVLMVVYIIAISYMMLRFKKTTKGRLVTIAIVGFFAFIFFANQIDLWHSAGFERSSSLLEDDDRFIFWSQMWAYIVSNNYFGYGLGGDYFTFGFYTHNILIDFLLETGIIGTAILIYCFYKLYIKILCNCSADNIFILLMIICIYGLVMNLFSGYWITTYSHWLALGVSMTCSYQFKSNLDIKV